MSGFWSRSSATSGPSSAELTAPATVTSKLMYPPDSSPTARASVTSTLVMSRDEPASPVGSVKVALGAGGPLGAGGGASILARPSRM